jgi:hypothetical protein
MENGERLSRDGRARVVTRARKIMWAFVLRPVRAGKSALRVARKKSKPAPPVRAFRRLVTDERTRYLGDFAFLL